MRDTQDEDGPSGRLPLKTVLQNFLNHVEDLEARRINNDLHLDTIVNDKGPWGKEEKDDAYDKEFAALKSFSDSLRSEYASSEGEKEVNRKKNRYKDILPFDYSRVLLSEYPGVPGSDYINANYIKGASGSNAYIASQGPLPHTVNDFWRMIVETEVQVIVMACNEQEAGKHKCEKYWPDDPEVEAQFGKYFIQLLKSRDICPDFLVRTMRLKWKENDVENERTVCQFHYGAWPDHGIPNQVKPLLEMVRLIRDCQASETLPVLVHCSAGCGRTGTICAIDFIWGLLRTGKLTSDFSLFELVKDMRRQRVAMVQTVDQYVLVHRAVKELFLEQLRVIDSHPYENVDDDGHPILNDDNNDYETVLVKDEKHEEAEVVEEKPPEPPPKLSPKQPQTEFKLFEPPKFKRGALKLTQDERGNWKLESNENNNEAAAAVATSVASIPTTTSQLLRRPSIKKIKAFFQQNKSSSADLEVNLLEVSSSKSVPSSLDRKISRAVSSEPQFNFNSLEKPPEKLSKPLLPIKRSKSMKSIANEDLEVKGSPQLQKPPQQQHDVQLPPPKPKRSIVHQNSSTSSTSDENRASSLMMASFDEAEREASKIGDMVALAQRKLSEASLNNVKPTRERRNSFREAVEKKSSASFEATDAEEEKKAYESIWFESPVYANVKRASEQLQSVSLVSQVLRKQNSSSSLTSSLSSNGKGPPPPYVQPPPPSSMKVASSSHDYANVQFRIKDDLVMPRTRTSTKMASNRYSCGDFSRLSEFKHSHSFSEPLATESSPPTRNVTSVRLGRDFDVDVDAIAATMQGHTARLSGSAGSSAVASPQMPRPLKTRAMGVISGVATNLKSRLTSVVAHQEPPRVVSGYIRTSPKHEAVMSSKRPSLGEQSPALIPLTVPGADTNRSSFPYGYPERLDLKPVGARDPPPHFQRKQEYL